jgi:hypothetical protein
MLFQTNFTKQFRDFFDSQTKENQSRISSVVNEKIQQAISQKNNSFVRFSFPGAMIFLTKIYPHTSNILTLEVHAENEVTYTDVLKAYTKALDAMEDALCTLDAAHADTYSIVNHTFSRDDFSDMLETMREKVQMLEERQAEAEATAKQRNENFISYPE